MRPHLYARRANVASESRCGNKSDARSADEFSAALAREMNDDDFKRMRQGLTSIRAEQRRRKVLLRLLHCRLFARA